MTDQFTERPTDEDDEDARTEDEEEALANARADLLDFLEELDAIREALDRIARGRADSLDLNLIYGATLRNGLLVCEHVTDWALLRRHARGAAS